jgi:hypothetical protein
LGMSNYPQKWMDIVTGTLIPTSPIYFILFYLYYYMYSNFKKLQTITHFLIKMFIYNIIQAQCDYVFNLKF